MKSITFQPNDQKLFIINFEHYDDQVHRSTDTIYVLTRRSLTPKQVLAEFAKQHDIGTLLERVDGVPGIAEARYIQVGRAYKIKVTKEPSFANHSIVSLK